jgi:LysM repeat protein
MENFNKSQAIIIVIVKSRFIAFGRSHLNEYFNIHKFMTSRNKNSLMKKIYTVSGLFLLTFLVLFSSCNSEKEYSSLNPINWKKRGVEAINIDSTVKGTSYLSVYSQVYSLTEHRTHSVTATVSIHNVNLEDTVYLHSAKYFNTAGQLIRTYFQNTIYIAPMETVQIVIDEKDKEGGTGANFLIDWEIEKGSNPPFFEGVMISTSGQQGISFTTEGIQIK